VSRTVAAVYGGVPIERQIEALGAGADVVVATPGRLIDLFERREVVLDAVAVLVLDEADRMADMGFTPQVEWLLRRVSPSRQTMLFSATLDGDVDHLVRHYLTDPVRHEVASERPTVEQMEHRFLAVHQMDKVRVAAAIAQGGQKTLVFVRTKHMADRLARDLVAEGVRAAAIHGDLRQSLREASLARFAAGKLPVGGAAALQTPQGGALDDDPQMGLEEAQGQARLFLLLREAHGRSIVDDPEVGTQVNGQGVGGIPEFRLRHHPAELVPGREPEGNLGALLVGWRADLEPGWAAQPDEGFAVELRQPTSAADGVPLPFRIGGDPGG
jgi:hypothetical protein